MRRCQRQAWLHAERQAAGSASPPRTPPAGGVPTPPCARRQCGSWPAPSLRRPPAGPLCHRPRRRPASLPSQTWPARSHPPLAAGKVAEIARNCIEGHSNKIHKQLSDFSQTQLRKPSHPKSDQLVCQILTNSSESHMCTCCCWNLLGTRRLLLARPGSTSVPGVPGVPGVPRVLGSLASLGSLGSLDFLGFAVGSI